MSPRSQPYAEGVPSTSAEEVSASTRKWLDRISDAIDVTDGIRLIVDGTVAVPPGLVAADGVELRVGLQIVSSDAGEGSVRGGAPELVVEVSQGDSYPGLRSAAWRGLQVPERWILRSEEHTSELQSLMRISYDVLCLKKKKQ